MRTAIKYVTLVTIISLIPIVILLGSYLHRLNKLSGDFTRLFPFNYTDAKFFDLHYNSYYIAGTIDTNIFLGNYSTIPQLLKMNSLLKDTATINVNIIAPNKNELGSYRIIVDSSNFYVYYGMRHTVMKGSTDNWTAFPLNIFSPYFHAAVPVSSSSMVFAYMNSKKNENSFRKESIGGAKIENDEILEKQVDGQFCTSGILEYNKQLNVLTYLYTYRNQILVMDTNLNLIKKIKTIDGIDTARFEVSKINSTGSKVITKPTILVNPKCATYKQYLLVHSKIMGKHEDDKQFEHSTVIDIYDIQQGHYVYSFSLPNNKKVNISQLKVINGDVYTMSGKYLNKYRIKLPE